ncbi:MAG: type II toxin-antitoxin system HicB family antitoxin [Armatimonadota bacterium]|nr:type II toxin-antitoxin system HicB family antitoxin [Armatimonadota bacterium]
MRYTAIVEKGRESGFVAYIPALKGCVSQGPTPDAAMRNLKEAAEAYIEALLEEPPAVARPRTPSPWKEEGWGEG